MSASSTQMNTNSGAASNPVHQEASSLINGQVDVVTVECSEHVSVVLLRHSCHPGSFRQIRTPCDVIACVRDEPVVLVHPLEVDRMAERGELNAAIDAGASLTMGDWAGRC